LLPDLTDLSREAGDVYTGNYTIANSVQ